MDIVACKAYWLHKDAAALHCNLVHFMIAPYK